MKRGGYRPNSGNKKGVPLKPAEEKKVFFAVGIKRKYLTQGKKRVLELADRINNTDKNYT